MSTGDLHADHGPIDDDMPTHRDGRGTGPIVIDRVRGMMVTLTSETRAK